ncbi:MAG: hypothetical protein IIV59_04755, partial [Selenomonadaceae bacterium]|nr:hypothetical protein [Selenomonadaceae bacterium]
RAVISVVGEYTDIYTASGEDGSPHSCMSWEDLNRAAGVERIELACHSYYFHHLTGRKGCARKGGDFYKVQNHSFPHFLPSKHHPYSIIQSLLRSSKLNISWHIPLHSF